MFGWMIVIEESRQHPPCLGMGQRVIGILRSCTTQPRALIGDGVIGKVRNLWQMTINGFPTPFFELVEEHANAAYLSPAGHVSPPARKKSVTLRVDDIGGHLLVPPGASTSASSETLTDQVIAHMSTLFVSKLQHR